jgi:hypothetical protein
MQDKEAARIVASWTGHRLFLPFVFALLDTLASQQFAVDVGDLFEVILQLVVIVDPTSHFGYSLCRHDSAGCATWPQGDRQVPARPVPLSLGALASGISAGHVALQQRPAEDLSDWRQLLGKTLAALAQNQFGEPT